MRLYIDHPPYSFSLAQFVSRANELYRPLRDFRFSNFVLTGEFEEYGRKYQAVIDPLQNIIDTRQEDLSISRDYDSLLGLTEDILVDCDIQVYSVPHPRFALKTSVHLTQELSFDGVDYTVQLHTIPNFELGTFGHRGHLHVFFPELWTPERAKGKAPYQLTLEERSECELPASVETEEIRARKSKGGSSLGSQIIPREGVALLCQTLRDALDENIVEENTFDSHWCKSFMILHTIRGVKQSTFHAIEDDGPHRSLEELMVQYHLSPRIWSEGFWYIDVGVEISSNDESCLQWNTFGHHELVRQALGIEKYHACRITSLGSSKYHRDYSSHLSAISGFRVVPGIRAQGPFGAQYMQVYTTDKAVLYNPERGHFGKFVTCAEALSVEHPIPTINGIHTIYEAAIHNNSSKGRIEVRVPLKHAKEVLTHFDTDRLRRCLCSFEPEVWWGFRIVRLQAISQVLAFQSGGPSELRVSREALSLTAACVWLLNGLHARPEDGSAARQLMDVALPRGLYEDDDYDPDEDGAPLLAYRNNNRNLRNARQQTPVISNGVVFFRRIAFTEVPRFRYGGPALVLGAFRYFFGKTFQEIEAKIVKPMIVNKELLRGKRMTTNKRKLPHYFVAEGEPLPRLFDNLGRSGERKVPPPVVDDGSDVEDLDDDAQPQLTVNEHVTLIWSQFLMDVPNKSPNPRGAGRHSYIKLDDEERGQGKEEVFKTLDLSLIFRTVAYRKGSLKDWQRAFGWLFPDRGVQIGASVQGYPTSIYFQKWLRWANDDRNDLDLLKSVRSALWDRFRNLEWIPDAQQDKMWPTGLTPAFQRWPENFNQKARKAYPAPRILLKGKALPEFSLPAEDPWAED
ncbi:hypothetical protein J132_10732 [Termitomyces sp. J132]|nr:hypothetical protein J132_10732 [Termitomyces sp. J132]